MKNTKIAVLLVMTGLMLSLGQVAVAQGQSDGELVVQRGSLFKIGTDVEITPNERAENIIVIGGDVLVSGTVLESVIAIGGTISITGEVRGDVVAVGGAVVIESGANVGGSVTTSDGEIAVSQDAQVDGEITENDLSVLFSEWDEIGRYGSKHIGVPGPVGFFVGLFTTLLLGLLLTYLMPGLITAQAEALERKPGKVLGWGVLALLGFVPLVIMLVITIVGIALVPLLILAYALSAFLGIVAASLVLGRYISHQIKLDKGTMILSVGLGIITLAILRLIPFFGDLLTVALWIGGWGVVILTRFGTQPVDQESTS